jgi:hypothetical protein
MGQSCQDRINVRYLVDESPFSDINIFIVISMSRVTDEIILIPSYRFTYQIPPLHESNLHWL